MKKFILLTTLSLFSLNSFADFSLSCPDIYQRIMHSKEVKKRKAARVAHDLGNGAFFMSLGSPVIGLSLLVPTLGLSIYSDLPSKEERVLRITEEGNRHLIQFTKHLQNKISSDITSDEVLGVIRDGLDSGLFCQDFPHIYSAGEVKDHVKSVMKSKYASRQ